MIFRYLWRLFWGMNYCFFAAFSIIVLLGAGTQYCYASLLVQVTPLDSGYLMVHVEDGEVIHHEGDTGDEVVSYSPALDTSVATSTGSWLITSSDDSAYGSSGLAPVACYRKSKLNGHAYIDSTYESTVEHWLYLQLPSPLQQGASYQLTIADDTNIATSRSTFTFDVFSTVSDAIHVNIVGYVPDAPQKSADLYAWMGDGGARDYSSYEGNTVYLYNVNTGKKRDIGSVTFWKENKSSFKAGYDLTLSDVWTADLPESTDEGTYRLVIEGIGASQDFTVSTSAYKKPFRTSLLGYFYMRVGEANTTNISPPTRTPLYIPGEGSPDTVVYLTDMTPYHDDWATISSYDNWDNPSAWADYVQSGSPTNANAYGGHADAADWDRHLQHVVNIYDMLLPYILTNGAASDDDSGISESGNGIPDILDEARYEVDFWLRLRDGDGYAYGLTNPGWKDNKFVIYQAGATAIAAWANAANAAMMAEAFRIDGNETLMTFYRDAAVEAYDYASSLSDQMLDKYIWEDDGNLRGRDLKMTAAAFLYTLTGDTSYEESVHEESICADGCADSTHLMYKGYRNQIYASAAYLVTPRTIHYQAMYDALYSQIISEAWEMEAGKSYTEPTRRGVDNLAATWQTAENMDRTLIAHAICTDKSEKKELLKALYLEADWGLGRNPLNIVQMTTPSSPLSDKAGFTESYTSGRNDGIAGVDPGQTPYMNISNWTTSGVGGRPSVLCAEGYPSAISAWPVAEAYFPSRYVYAHTEFTPRQTMRGKMALYTYLWGLGAQSTAAVSQFSWPLFLPAILHNGKRHI